LTRGGLLFTEVEMTYPSSFSSITTKNTKEETRLFFFDTEETRLGATKTWSHLPALPPCDRLLTPPIQPVMAGGTFSNRRPPHMRHLRAIKFSPSRSADAAIPWVPSPRPGYSSPNLSSCESTAINQHSPAPSMSIKHFPSINPWSTPPAPRSGLRCRSLTRRRLHVAFPLSSCAAMMLEKNCCFSALLRGLGFVTSKGRPLFG
jgi:hypothetical protein